MQNHSITEYLSFPTKAGASFLRRPPRSVRPPNLSRGQQRKDGREDGDNSRSNCHSHRLAIACVRWITDK